MAGAEENLGGGENKLNHTVNATAYDWMQLLNNHLTSDIIMNHYCLKMYDENSTVKSVK